MYNYLHGVPKNYKRCIYLKRKSMDNDIHLLEEVMTTMFPLILVILLKSLNASFPFSFRYPKEINLKNFCLKNTCCSRNMKIPFFFICDNQEAITSCVIYLTVSVWQENVLFCPYLIFDTTDIIYIYCHDHAQFVTDEVNIITSPNFYNIPP